MTIPDGIGVLCCLLLRISLALFTNTLTAAWRGLIGIHFGHSARISTREDDCQRVEEGVATGTKGPQVTYCGCLVPLVSGAVHGLARLK